MFTTMARTSLTMPRAMLCRPKVPKPARAVVTTSPDPRTARNTKLRPSRLTKFGLSAPGRFQTWDIEKRPDCAKPGTSPKKGEETHDSPITELRCRPWIWLPS